jgi:cytochrome P450
VYWHAERDGMPGFWTLTRYDDIVQVLRQPEVFSSAGGILLRPTAHGQDPGGGQTLALTDPPRHRKLRALVSDWFTERAVRLLKDDMEQIVSAVLDRAPDGETCDFVETVAARLPLYVICRLMGVPDEDREHLFGLTSRAFGAEQAGVRRMAHVEMMEYFTRLGDERRRRPREDIISALVTAEIDGQALTERELILNCDNVLVGGTENVRIASAGGLVALLRHAEQWAALRADADLVPSAVEEILRWTTTPTHIMRTATRPMKIQRRDIQAGERVTLWLPSANRDEAVFAEPDRFDIRRTPNRHLTLGIGEHFCLGGTLARSELRTLYRGLAKRFASAELAGPITWLRSIVVNGPERMPVRLVP